MSRIAVPIALGDRDEHVGAAQIAGHDEILRLRRVVVTKIQNALPSVGRDGCHVV
jgi:hypothetical protein